MGSRLLTDRLCCFRLRVELLLSGALLCLATGPVWGQLARQPSSARACAVCHLQWVEAFDAPGTLTLIPGPARPVVADEEVCLGCHDGSVADSRERVWLEHGHATGIEPPADMPVPDELPLRDGKLACRTCHTAHLGTGPETLKSTFFLRVENDAGQMCQMCHTQQMGGVMAGHHPQGTMSIALPEALSVHGASAGEQGNVMNCQSCHTPHGSAFDNLNVADPQTNDLCLPCHQELSPGRWTADSPGHHNTAKPIANPDHAEAIRNMGCRIGHDNQMICASCHQMHNANADHHLLGATLTDSQICIECHEQPAAMLNTAHDLRGSECDQPNLLGQTPTEAGPCSSCHAAHQQAREPFVQPGDPTGTCTTCHAEDRCAGKVSQTGISHPNTAASTCQSCHKPHDNMHEPFLQKRHDELCASCHAKQHSHLGGAHDFADRPDLTNAHGYHPERTGLCGFCHGIHNANGPSLWVATETPPKHPNDYCLSCHQAGGMAASHPTPPLLHPSGQATAGSPLNKNAKLPRYNEQLAHADEGMIACGTCHAVHGDSEQSPALIRNVAGADSLQMCLQCHESAKSIQTSLHAPEFIGRHAEVMSDHGSTEYCAPCHQVHHPDRTAEASKLENEPDAVARMWFAPTGDPKLPADLRQCLGCHSASGGAKQVNVVTHPAIPMQNIVEPSDPGYMPLADEKGTLGSGGRVTCRTCHLPHGRSFDNNKKAGEKETTPVRLRAKKPMIRRYADNSLCVNCHGAEGLHLYLYYHYPEKRR